MTISSEGEQLVKDLQEHKNNSNCSKRCGKTAKPAPPQAERPPRHARWVAIYEAVHTLRARGTPIATMARQLRISRPTVYAYLRRDTPPGPRQLQRPPSARVLPPYVPYLIRRWRESGADSRQLWREIQTLGYTIPPGRSAASSPGCDGPRTWDIHRRRSAHRTRAPRGRRPVQCRSSWCARPPSGHARPRRIWASCARSMRVSRGRMG